MRQDNAGFAEIIEPSDKINIILKQLNEIVDLIADLGDDLWFMERTE
jgi:hypothetical protein